MRQAHRGGHYFHSMEKEMIALDEPFNAEIDWHLEIGEDDKLDLKQLLGTSEDTYDNGTAPDEREDSAGNEKARKKDKKRKADTITGPSRHRGRKKPAGMPKRPLSAYNLFFQSERKAIFEESSQRIGFEELGKVIGQRWRSLNEKERRSYEQMAEKDIQRYREQMEVFDESRRKRFMSSKIDPAPAASTLLDDDTTEKKGIVTKAVTATGQLALPSVTSSGPIQAILASAQAAAPLAANLWGEQNSSSRSVSHEAPLTSPGSYYHPPPPLTGVHSNNPVEPPKHQNLALPAGLEVTLPDGHGRERKYKVHYSCYRMTRAEADAYMLQLSQNAPVTSTVETSTNEHYHHHHHPQHYEGPSPSEQ